MPTRLTLASLMVGIVTETDRKCRRLARSSRVHFKQGRRQQRDYRDFRGRRNSTFGAVYSRNHANVTPVPKIYRKKAEMRLVGGFLGRPLSEKTPSLTARGFLRTGLLSQQPILPSTTNDTLQIRPAFP